ncbi:MAG: IS1634 family transposase [Bacteroidales bacterium]
MFIREVKKKNSKTGKTFYQYQLVQASRIEGKVKQQSLLYLGSEALLANKVNRDMLVQVLEPMIFGQSLLYAKDYPGFIHNLAREYYEKFTIKYKDTTIEKPFSVPPVSHKSQMETVDVASIDIEGSRTFGGEHLCKQVMDRLDLQACLSSLGFSPKDVNLALISIIGRALFKSSEYKTASYLQDNSELQHMCNYGHKKISHNSLYEISDKLYTHKEDIDKFLYRRFIDMFDIKDTLVIYDLSNTYFEGRKTTSQLAKYGRNKEKRNDCKQVVFTGVINQQGFIRYSRVYEGNKPDVSTLKEMISDLKKHSKEYAEKIVVIDAGIASEDNIGYLIEENLKYVCVSRKQIRNYLIDNTNPVISIKDKRDNPIELQLFTHEGYKDTWMLVKSEQKRVKEQSMSDKLSNRFEEELTGLALGLNKKGATKKTDKIWERLGRIKEKHRLVSGRYHIEVIENNGKVINLTWHKKQGTGKSDNDNGMYFIRTNIDKSDEKQIWDVYNTIREVESTFRCLKTDLQIRPVFHQKDERVESHLYLAILAYQLVNTIRYMLKEKGINHDWRNIVRIMNTQTIQSIVLNAETKKICIRKPSKPIQEALDIYQATSTNSMVPDKKKYVVYH